MTKEKSDKATLLRADETSKRIDFLGGGHRIRNSIDRYVGMCSEPLDGPDIHSATWALADVHRGLFNFVFNKHTQNCYVLAACVWLEDTTRM